LDRCRAALARSAPTALGDPVARTVGDLLCRGKLLRGLIVYLAGGASGGCPAVLDTPAHAIELLHGASLIHDDIVDHAAHRRGVPALHKQVGPEVALILGDYLLVHAYSVLAGAGDLAAEAVRVVSRYAQECCVGQARELGPKDPVTEDVYVSTVRAKTGAVFAAAAELGVLAAGGGAELRAAARQYGESLGVAYQVGDDVVDLSGDGPEPGEPVGLLLAGQRATLPLIYMAERGIAPSAHSRGLVEALEWEEVLRCVRATQRRYIDAAVEALRAFGPSFEVRALGSLARFAGRPLC
jgi:geranylgeranyl pyrophosphate synthase